MNSHDLLIFIIVIGASLSTISIVRSVYRKHKPKK